MSGAMLRRRAAIRAPFRPAALALFLVGAAAAPPPAAPAAAATCDRVCLEAIARRYLQAYAARDPGQAPIADDVRFTENNVELAFPKASWRAITREAGPALIFSDPVAGEVGVTTAIWMMDTPGYLAVRLKVRHRRIVEIEHLLSTKRFVGTEPLQNADGKPLVHEPEMARVLAPAERVPRAAMIAQADAYWQTLGDDRDGRPKRGLRFLAGCKRVENGLPFQNGLGCDAGFRNGIYGFNERVRDRDYMLVDETRGIVMSRAFIDHVGDLDTITTLDGKVHRVPFREPHSWSVVETFKIVNGAIASIEANFIGSPYGTRAPWTAHPQR